MIRVRIYVNERHAYTGFELSGHAGYAESGEDIVCAAVSMLVINTINALDTYTADKVTCTSDEEQGCIRCQFSEPISHDAKLLLDTMVLGLQSIEDNSEYEPYIDIIFKEV